MHETRTLALVSRQNPSRPQIALLRRPAAALSLLGLFLVGCGTPFATRDHLTLSAPRPTDRLVVDNSVGRITVKADPAATEVKAEIIKIGKGCNQHEADQAVADIEVSLANADGVVRAEAKHPGGTGIRGYEVQWQITAPPDVDIDVTNDVGDLHISGFQKNISLKNDVGDAVVIADPADGEPGGMVKVTTGVGSIRADNARNGLTATTDVGNIFALAGGAVDLRSDVGSVSLKLLPTTADTVKLATDVGDVRIYLTPDQQGSILADCDVGDVRLSIDDAKIKTLRERRHHCTAQLGESRTPAIDLTSDVGDIRISSFDPAAAAKP